MKATSAIGVILLVSILHYGVLGFHGYDPSDEAGTLMQWILVFTFAWWVHQDAGRRSFHRPYELGAFAFLFWWVAMPAYLVATRGWRGVTVFVIFVALLYVPWLLGWLAYYSNPSNHS